MKLLYFRKLRSSTEALSDKFWMLSLLVACHAYLFDTYVIASQWTVFFFQTILFFNSFVPDNNARQHG